MYHSSISAQGLARELLKPPAVAAGGTRSGKNLNPVTEPTGVSAGGLQRTLMYLALEDERVSVNALGVHGVYNFVNSYSSV